MSDGPPTNSSVVVLREDIPRVRGSTPPPPLLTRKKLMSDAFWVINKSETR